VLVCLQVAMAVPSYDTSLLMIAVHSTSPFGGSIAHLFLLYALFSTLAHVLDKSALYGN